VYFRHAAQKTHLVFDNENLCSAAGVESAMRPGWTAWCPATSASPLKIGCLVTGMLMGADSIDDMNLLRDCGLHHVLTEVRAIG
jgi:hypothetical protein